MTCTVEIMSFRISLWFQGKVCSKENQWQYAYKINSQINNTTPLSITMKVIIDTELHMPSSQKDTSSSVRTLELVCLHKKTFSAKCKVCSLLYINGGY